MDFGRIIKRAPRRVHFAPRAVAKRKIAGRWLNLQVDQGANCVLDAFQQCERLGDQPKASAVKIVAHGVNLDERKRAKMEGHETFAAVPLPIAGALGEGDNGTRQARLRLVGDWISGKRSH